MRVTEQEFARLSSRATGTPLPVIAERARASLTAAQGEVSAADAGQPKRKRKIGVSGVVKPPTEHAEQAALFRWAEGLEPIYPQLMMLFAIPNGAGVNHQRNRHGQRFSLEGAKLKREGMKQGVPDVFLAAPFGKWHGLFIEMKRVKKSLSKVTPEQLGWKTALEGMGYRVEICYGWEAARDVILDYLGVQ